MALRFTSAAVRWAFRSCADLAGFALVCLMIITVIDIVGRHLGVLTIRGFIEISTIAVVLIGFLALPYSFIVGGHILVDLVTQFFSGRTSRRLDVLWSLFAAVGFSVMAALMWRTTLEIHRQNAVSLDLQLPMIIFWLPATIGASLAPFGCLFALLRDRNERSRSLGSDQPTSREDM